MAAAIVARNVCSRLDEIIILKSGRKKCLVSTLDALANVRTKIGEIFEELIMENSVLLGRLREARVATEATRIEKDKILEKLIKMNTEVKAKERQPLAVVDKPVKTASSKPKQKTGKKVHTLESDTTDVEKVTRTMRNAPECEFCAIYCSENITVFDIILSVIFSYH